MSDTEPITLGESEPFLEVTEGGGFLVTDFFDLYDIALMGDPNFDIGTFTTQWLERLAGAEGLNGRLVSQPTLDNLAALTGQVNGMVEHGLLYPSAPGFLRVDVHQRGCHHRDPGHGEHRPVHRLSAHLCRQAGQIVQGVSTLPSMPATAPSAYPSAPPVSATTWQPWSSLFRHHFPGWPGPRHLPRRPAAGRPVHPGRPRGQKGPGRHLALHHHHVWRRCRVAKAVSAAMQAKTAALTKLVAQAVDQALGGLQPGQAKSQMLGTARKTLTPSRSP